MSIRVIVKNGTAYAVARLLEDHMRDMAAEDFLDGSADIQWESHTDHWDQDPSQPLEWVSRLEADVTFLDFPETHGGIITVEIVPLHHPQMEGTELRIQHNAPDVEELLWGLLEAVEVRWDIATEPSWVLDMILNAELRDYSEVVELVQSETQTSLYAFLKKGELWEIAYAGPSFLLKDVKGLNYIAYLLSNPHKEIDVLTLVAAVEGNTPPDPKNTKRAVQSMASASSDENDSRNENPDRYASLDRVTGGVDDYPVIDGQTSDDLKQRLHELAGERRQAELRGDESALREIDGETKVIDEYLHSSTGLGGKPRRFPGSQEKARISVQKAIKLATDKIAQHASALSEHLDTHIKTGSTCSYHPDPDMQIQWDVKMRV